MRKVVPVLVAALGIAAASRASAQTLNIGDAAPKLAVKQFVKGKPVAGFEKGKIYVVEFWATWCGPCRVSIPHLTELQKKHKDVTFVGVSVWENDQKQVKPFVDQMGDKMGYCVAMDDVPAGAKGEAGVMAKTWMQAAGQDGIPAAFIIGKDARIAWIGHPMEMEEPLGKVVAGKYDVATAAAESRKKAAAQAKLNQIRDKFVKAQQAGDTRQMLALIEQAIAEEPAIESMLGPQKLSLLLKSNEQDKAADYLARLLDGPLRNEPMGINNAVWMVVDPEAGIKPSAKLLAIALRGAQRADELAKGKDAAIADTLAKAYFDSGNVARAIECQERALKLAKGTPLEQDTGIAARLEQYKKAAGK